MKRIIPINKESGYEWNEKELYIENEITEGN